MSIIPTYLLNKHISMVKWHYVFKYGWMHENTHILLPSEFENYENEFTSVNP